MVTSIPFLVAKIPDDNDFLSLKEMAYFHEDWSLDYDKGAIKIWSKIVPDAAIKMVKVWSLFSSISSSELYNTLMDAQYRKEWDPHMIMAYDIGHLNPNNGISYYAVSCPPPLKSRDFVLQTSWLDRGSEQFILNHSVCHKEHPPKKSYIRAISHFTGYFIKCISLNGCEMSFVSQTDPQGIVPAWIVNKCTQIFAPRFVKQLEKAASAYCEWKSQNNPDFFPWIHPEQMTSPKITIEDCIPSEEEQESPFFKYLAEKNVKNVAPEENSKPIRVQFSSPTIPGCSKLLETPCATSEPNSSDVNNEINNETTTVESEKGKQKKSKKSSWLEFTKTCFSKKPDS